MKKRVYGRKLSRERDTRRALFRALIRALVMHGKIKTTKAKAKAVQPLVDKIVNLAKKESTAARRRLFGILGNDKITTKNLLTKVAPALRDREGGYTRIIALPRRKGDAAEMARLEWVNKVPDKKEKGKRTKKVKRKKKEKMNSL